MIFIWPLGSPFYSPRTDKKSDGDASIEADASFENAMANSFMGAMGFDSPSAGASYTREQERTAEAYFSSSTLNVWGGDTELFSSENYDGWLNSVDSSPKILPGTGASPLALVGLWDVVPASFGVSPDAMKVCARKDSE